MNEATWGQKIVLVIIGIVVVIVLMFNILKTIRCSPDEKVKEVALPLATVIIKYIEKNGVPKSLQEVQEIPYQLKDCNITRHEESMRDYISIEDREKCYFITKDKKYKLRVEHSHSTNNYGRYRHIYINIKQNKTEYMYQIYYDKKIKKWLYEHYPNANVYHYSTRAICNPKLFRITD